MRRKNEKSAEVVRRAADVFAKKGYHGTSVTDLCEALGVRPGTLYYHIGSKEKLLIRIHEAFIEPLIERLRSCVGSTSDPIEALRAFSRELMRTIAADKALVTVFFEMFIPRGEQRWAQVEANRDRVVHLLESILAEGQVQGIFVIPDAIPHLKISALGFLGMHNWAHRWIDPTGPLSPEDISEIFVTQYLNGICISDHLRSSRVARRAAGR